MRRRASDRPWAPPAPLDVGACVISIDTELAWGGAHHRNGAATRRHPGFDDERWLVAETLRVFERHGIPATWAVVGHLFLDRCAPGPDGRPHGEVARPRYPWLGGEDWFAIDPCTTLEQDPFYYGRDIVEQILACPVVQEVACHGFSHAMIGADGVTADVFDAELAASAQAAGTLSVAPRSFVYPRNLVGHVDRLPAHGYVAYRGRRTAVPFATRPAWLRLVLRAVDRLRPLAGSAVRPARHASGIWNLPQTYLFAPATQRSSAPVCLWVRRPLARLQQAARHRGLFHLWFHPYNLTDNPTRAIAALERICAEAARLRDEGRLDVVTMGQLADRLAAADGVARVGPRP